jgi:hypothetical protein
MESQNANQLVEFAFSEMALRIRLASCKYRSDRGLNLFLCLFLTILHNFDANHMTAKSLAAVVP